MCFNVTFLPANQKLNLSLNNNILMSDVFVQNKGHFSLDELWDSEQSVFNLIKQVYCLI